MLEIQELLIEMAIGSGRSFQVAYMFFPFRCLTRFTGEVGTLKSLDIMENECVLLC